MVGVVETVAVETAVPLTVAHLVVIVVRVRKETDHREIVALVHKVATTEVRAHRVTDPSVHLETVRRVQQVQEIVVRVRKETDHKGIVQWEIVALVHKVTGPSAQWEIVPPVHRDWETVNLVQSRLQQPRRLSSTRLP